MKKGSVEVQLVESLGRRVPRSTWDTKSARCQRIEMSCVPLKNGNLSFGNYRRLVDRYMVENVVIPHFPDVPQD